MNPLLYDHPLIWTYFKFDSTIVRHETDTSRYHASSEQQQEEEDGDDGKAEFCFQFYVDHKNRFNVKRIGDDAAFVLREEYCGLCRGRLRYSVKVDPYTTDHGIGSLEGAVYEMLSKVGTRYLRVEADDIDGAFRSIVEEAKSLIDDARAMGRKKTGMDVKIKVWTDYLYDEEEMMEMAVLESAEEGENYGFVPASRSAINKLKKMVLKKDAIGRGGDGCHNCRICLEDLEIGIEVTCMPCSHIFHPGCIDEWLGRHHVCPLCRYKLPI